MKHFLLCRLLDQQDQRFIIYLLSLFIFILLFADVQAQTRRYVKQNGLTASAGAGNPRYGLSWDNASSDLQDMINKSAVGDIVWVAKGVYKPIRNADRWTPTNFPAVNTGNRNNAFVLKEGVQIYGGFANNLSDANGSISTRNLIADTTILSGNIGDVSIATDNCYHVVIGAGTLTAKTILDGFTVKDGYSDKNETITVNGDATVIHSNYGGGIYTTGSPTLINVRITGNHTKYSGGGIYNNIGSPTLINVQITGNTANNDYGIGYGGGMSNYNGSPTLTNVQITGNTAANNGGGIYNIWYSPLTLTNVQITGNKAIGNDGGGIYNAWYSPLTLTNVQITGNTSGDVGGGICNNVAYCMLINVTIAGNHAKHCGGISFHSNEVNQVRNSIIYGNTTQRTDPNVSDYTANIYSYSLVEGATNTNATHIISNANPQFVNLITATRDKPTSGGDYQLSPSNPAINMGYDSYNNTTTDLAGNPRFNGAIDLGAFEYLCVNLEPPAATNVSAAVICNGTAPTIKIKNTINGLTYKVYSSSDSTTPVGEQKSTSTGSELSILCENNLSADTTYHVGTYNGICSSSTRASVSITVVQTPSVPKPSASATCSGEKPVVSLSTSESGVKYRMYDSGCSAVSDEVSGTGSEISIPCTYTLTSATTYYVKASRTSSGITCISSLKPVNVTVNAKPTVTISK
jgi:hypothetical protein